MSAPPANYQEVNRALWDAKTSYHVGSAFYDVPGFLQNPSSLKGIELALLGEIRGLRVLHLQCHFGQDTISLASLGAEVTGLDFSEVAIAEARKLAAATGSAATFVCANVYATREVLSDRYDLVYSSYGTICWLPDLEKWARVIADSLRPGGRFVFAEFHPVLWAYSDDFSTLQYGYFNRAPILDTSEGTYAEVGAPIKLPSVSWNHPLQDVIGALLRAGLQLTRFEEYDYSPSNCFQNTVEAAPQRFMIRGMEGKIPMVYALEAVKPAS